VSPAVRLVAAVLLFPLAGCLQGASHAHAPPQQAGPALLLASPRLELVGCTADLLQYRTDGSRLAPFLPPGYAARPLLGPLVGVSVTAYACRSAVLDGESVVPDLRWLQVHASVRAPAPVAGNGSTDQFLFELLVSDAAVQRLLAAQGIPASLGRFEVDRQGSVTRLRVLQDGALLAEYAGSGAVGGAAYDHAEARRYHAAAGGVPAFFDVAWTGTLSGYQTEEEGVLSAHGGFVAQTLPAPGSTAANRGDATGTLTFDFHGRPAAAGPASSASSPNNGP
jgi:hypothetical protein